MKLFSLFTICLLMVVACFLNVACNNQQDQQRGTTSSKEVSPPPHGDIPPIVTTSPTEVSTVSLKVGDNMSDFSIIYEQDKVENQYTNINGVETYTVIFKPGGTVRGEDKQGTILTYTSKSGATIHLDANREITSIVGSVNLITE